jgi:hypothetical protein
MTAPTIANAWANVPSNTNNNNMETYLTNVYNQLGTLQGAGAITATVQNELQDWFVEEVVTTIAKNLGG